MNFGQAIQVLRQGGAVTRTGWNGKNLKLRLQVPDENSKMTLPYIYLEYPPMPVKSLENEIKQTSPDRVPWLASQTDMLGEDWEVVAE